MKRAYQIAKEYDAKCHGFVETGGQIMILGPKYNKANWVIKDADPRRANLEKMWGWYIWKEGSIATSGDYEEFHRGWCQVPPHNPIQRAVCQLMAQSVLQLSVATQLSQMPFLQQPLCWVKRVGFLLITPFSQSMAQRFFGNT